MIQCGTCGWIEVGGAFHPVIAAHYLLLNREHTESDCYRKLVTCPTCGLNNDKWLQKCISDDFNYGTDDPVKPKKQDGPKRSPIKRRTKAEIEADEALLANTS